jgi:hypothetical protein
LSEGGDSSAVRVFADGVEADDRLESPTVWMRAIVWSSSAVWMRAAVSSWSAV